MDRQINQSQLNKARQDKFLMILNLPPILRDNIAVKNLNDRSNNTIIENSLQFSVYGSIVPTISVPEKQLPYAGQTYKISSLTRPAYDNLNVNFNIDNLYNNYWVIYQWLNVLNNEEQSYFNSNNLGTNEQSPTSTGYSADPASLYQTDLTIFGLDEYDNNVIRFDYTRAFPISLGNIDYNYQQQSEIISSVSFAFFQLKVSLIDQ